MITMMLRTCAAKLARHQSLRLHESLEVDLHEPERVEQALRALELAGILGQGPQRLGRVQQLDEAPQAIGSGSRGVRQAGGGRGGRLLGRRADPRLEVRRLLALAGDAGAVDGLLGVGEPRDRAEQRERRQAEDLIAPGDLAEPDQVRAAAGEHAQVLAGGVAAAALPRAAGDRIPGRLEGAAADVERIGVGRLDRRVRPRDDHLVEARRERALLAEQADVRVREAGQLRDRRPQAGDEAAQLGPRHQPPDLLEHRQPGPQRLGALQDARQRLASERAHGRQRAVQGLERRLPFGEEAGQALDRLSERHAPPPRRRRSPGAGW